MNDSYFVPVGKYHDIKILPAVTLTLLFLGLFVAHHILDTLKNLYWPILPVWLLAAMVTAFQWIVSWWDKPWKVSGPEEQAWLDSLFVCVNIPVFNEDPELLDRSIWALFNQTRVPQLIDIVDDGSTVDYTRIREHWVGSWDNGIEVRWQRQHNQGKKFAQSATFASVLEADIFVTQDSDTCFDRQAINRGLRPFLDERNASVAGFELVYNQAENWLTRTVSVRNIAYQLSTWGAQSALGDVLVNRGPFALYWAQNIREIVYAYTHETFIGKRPIILGDDAALTLFSRDRGRTVQQVNAFCYAMHPETFRQHFKQWTRWMRGSIIRDCWRWKYLPMRSWGFMFTWMRNYLYLVSPVLPVLIWWYWPRSERILADIMVFVILLPIVINVRTLTISRNDETTGFRLGQLFVYPAAILWCILVLRWIRWYALVTWWKQGWITRVNGVEIGVRHDPDHRYRVDEVAEHVGGVQ
jgi:hyaluronan synthase